MANCIVNDVHLLSLRVCLKKNKVIFPMAECNKTSGKCFFLHTTGGLGIGHVTKRWAVAFAASAITDLPTHPP